MVNNTSPTGGGGIYCPGANPTITNCIIRGNTPEQISGGNPIVTYSNIEGGWAGEGNVDADACFVDPDHDGYDIGPASPCIDAARNDAVPAGIDTDINGDPRFVDDSFTEDTGVGDPPIVDMGANEYQADATGMVVFPAAGLVSEGPNGGPFAPDSITYTVRNYEATPLEFSAAKSEPWLDLSTGGGVIPVGAEVQVVVSIGDYAAGMPNGEYEDLVQIVNETNHDGDTTRFVNLTVGIPLPVMAFDLTTDPGWAMEGEWEFGQPTGQGGAQFGYPDPASGATGLNVYGVNLNGDYSSTPGGPYYLTTAALDCSDLTKVQLHFQRWLNTDYQPYAYATIEASADGSNWTIIWENGGYDVAENAWSGQMLEISAIADNQPALQIRWGYEITAGVWPYSGWNIDDVQIWGVEPGNPCLCDVNDDGVVNIDDLFAVLGHWGQGVGLYDVNLDGTVDIDDIFEVLGNWGPCPRR